MIKRDKYRSIYFNDERKWKASCLHDDVLQVGKQKAIGYIYDEKCAEVLSAYFLMQTNFAKEGKLTHVKSSLHSNGETLILSVGDVNMIQSILDNNKILLSTYGWQCDAKWVFNKICEEQVYHNAFPDESSLKNKIVSKDIYHMICDLFNSWCLWCEEKIWYKNGIRLDKPLSVNPYDPDEV